MQVTETLWAITFTILAVSYKGVTGNQRAEDCNAEQCESEVSKILNKSNYDCLNDPKEIFEALAPCRLVTCDQSVRDYLVPLGRRIQDRAVNANCPVRQTQSGRDCSLAESFECAMGSANLALILPALQIADMNKLCRDIASILNTLNVCQKCVQGLIPGWQDWSMDVDYIFNVSVTLGNGGCNCSRMIVDHVKNINTSSSCAVVRTVVNFARTIASDCTVKLVNYPLNLDWLGILDNYINLFFPFTATLCGTVSKASRGPFGDISTLYLLLVPLLLLLLMQRWRAART